MRLIYLQALDQFSRTHNQCDIVENSFDKIREYEYLVPAPECVLIASESMFAHLCLGL